MHDGTEKICADCGSAFVFSEKEAAFLQKVAPQINGAPQPLPAPEFCPACRERQRLVFRNEWSFYRRKCDATAKDVISIYDPSSPYRVFEPVYWWSDSFDPLDYGREFDFSRPFFEQFSELNLAVPKAAIQNAKSENSAYTNYSAENKNCYLCAGSGNNEDCYYGYRIFQCKYVCDCFDLRTCESCYGCLHGTNLYGCVFSSNCHDSSGLTHCENCRGCHDCCGCANLQNARFCLFNKELGEKVYRERLAELAANIGQDGFPEGALRSERDRYIINCEECSGDQLINCSRCESCFMLNGSQDCCYCGSGEIDRDCYDCNFSDDSELQYFTTNHRHNYRVMFSALVWYSHEVAYSTNCFNSNNLFGCSGMKRNEYGILNRAYKPAQYADLLQRIIAHMRETGEWGRYFPGRLSPFPYNCTVAHEYYPLTAEAALQRGLTWHTEESEVEHKRKTTRSEPASAGAAICSVTGKPFKISRQERELCERLGIALPVKCPDVRRHERMKEVKRALINYY